MGIPIPRRSLHRYGRPSVLQSYPTSGANLPSKIATDFKPRNNSSELLARAASFFISRTKRVFVNCWPLPLPQGKIMQLQSAEKMCPNGATYVSPGRVPRRKAASVALGSRAPTKSQAPTGRYQFQHLFRPVGASDKSAIPTPRPALALGLGWRRLPLWGTVCEPAAVTSCCTRGEGTVKWQLIRCLQFTNNI